MRPHVVRLTLLLALVVLAPLVGCFQKLDPTASSQSAASATDALVTEIDPSSAPIALSQTDAAMSSDPCDKTRQDKTQILTAYCAKCHSGPAAVGLPPWDFVLDDQKLVTETWVRAGQPAERFVIPGDPDYSALYQRMALVQDMPPQPTDSSTPPNPKPSPADNTVIRAWILNCLGVAGGIDAGGQGGGPGTGGMGATGGAGGSATTDGSAGAAGAAGGRSGGTAGPGGAPPACGASVAAGVSCAVHRATCTLNQKACTCELCNGRWQWVCS